MPEPSDEGKNTSSSWKNPIQISRIIQDLNPEETKNRLSPAESPQEEIICSSAQMTLIEEILKNSHKRARRKMRKGREVWQESLEKSSHSFKDRVDKEIKSLKIRISELETENSSLNNKIGEMEKHSIEPIGQLEKDIKKVSENTSLKIRIEQMELNDSTRQEESVKQNQKNQTMEKNVKYLLGKTTDLENRSRRDNLRIIGLPEKYDEKKSLDTIFQEIIKENCPGVIETEGKIDIERIHRSPTERDPKIKTPRNILAKCQNPQIKEKILQVARKTQFKYKGATIRITQDLAASTLKDRRAWNMIFQKAKELGMQPKITYPARMSTFFQGRRWTFNEISKFHLFFKITFY
uniref:L1 transposable element RRM domain-containing protein n=1 Tax=Sarcophilus harrisii TaxID=9305 RepID=A0A7N4Q1F3_SARHA